jgi:glycosyltransferase involved in cell wall biosynthesis
MKKLNILQFICPSGFYGAEIWILALAKNLDPNRIQCHLAVTHESEAQNLELATRYQNLGLESHQLRMRGRFDPTAIISLCQLIRNKKIDVLHTHGYKSDIIGLTAARLMGIKCVATPHGFENAPNRKLQFFIRLGCLALKHFDRVTPLSKDLMLEMQRIGIDRSKIELITNGVDLDEVEAEQREQNPPLYVDFPDKKISYVGQLAHRKNVADLIKTFDLLHRNHKNVRLFLIGDGPQRPKLHEIARTLPSSEKIHFLGYRKDRLKIVKETSLFAMTSSMEGIPRCMMEAMALGIPVAAYDIPGVSELVTNEETGLLAPHGDVEALERCWERILFDPDLAIRLAANARRNVYERFSAKRMSEEFTTLYTSVTT